MKCTISNNTTPNMNSWQRLNYAFRVQSSHFTIRENASMHIASCLYVAHKNNSPMRQNLIQQVYQESARWLDTCNIETSTRAKFTVTQCKSEAVHLGSSTAKFSCSSSWDTWPDWSTRHPANLRNRSSIWGPIWAKAVRMCEVRLLKLSSMLCFIDMYWATSLYTSFLSPSRSRRQKKLRVSSLVIFGTTRLHAQQIVRRAMDAQHRAATTAQTIILQIPSELLETGYQFIETKTKDMRILGTISNYTSLCKGTNNLHACGTLVGHRRIKLPLNTWNKLKNNHEQICVSSTYFKYVATRVNIVNPIIWFADV